MAGQEKSDSKGKALDFGSSSDQKRSPTGQVPAQRGTSAGLLAQKAPATTPPSRPSSTELPAVRAATGTIPAQGGHGAAGPVPAAGPAQSQPKNLTAYQKQQLSSAFGDSAKDRQRSNFLGTDAGTVRASKPELPAMPMVKFDGNTAPSMLTGRDVWKAVQAPVQSREGHRSGDVLDQLIKQFAVGTNPRYEPDGPERPRGHIFLWDVSRAMGCEVPHFVGAKELTLGQTCDWLRHEGPMRGWQRLGEDDAFAAADAGQLVVAMPRDIKVKQLAIVYPQDPPDDGRPLLAAAAKRRGSGLKVVEAFGLPQADYFTHA